MQASLGPCDESINFVSQLPKFARRRRCRHRTQYRGPFVSNLDKVLQDRPPVFHEVDLDAA
ncbi:hypothetical protein [Burkholderia cenocepacia]|uniref:hypothetical protein n=1 Tax=Burkholderia cenocepacia TaxID=95486 RepID=UPI002AAF60A9|nr:hypothetical protein [Burkholderia cenocepacia]